MLGQNEAFIQGLDMGMDLRLKFRATMDNRVRDSHANLDGSFSNGKGEFYFPSAGEWCIIASTGIAREDCNCRCGSITIWEGMPAHKMRASFPDDIPKDITFQEWAEKIGLTKNRYGQIYEFAA
jgi:uncharacterized protein with gpF-like domain